MRGLILVVEDSPEDADRIAAGLRARQWEVEVVADGLSALGRLRVEPRPRALVLDLAVPTIDGYAVFDELSNNKVFLKLPVVVVTGATTVDMAMLEGVAAVLNKPRDPAGWDGVLDDLHAALVSIRG
jgi:putative two-component system response regulator